MVYLGPPPRIAGLGYPPKVSRPQESPPVTSPAPRPGKRKEAPLPPGDVTRREFRSSEVGISCESPTRMDRERSDTADPNVGPD